MHSPHQRDAHPQPVCSRRIFLGSALAASASVVAGALAGCQRPSTLEVVQPTTGGGRDDLSDSVIGKDKIRIGMEAAYAPYNWQVSEASEYTIPIDNVQGAYADGYDVQIAKAIAEGLGKELVIVKLSWDGLIDALNQGQIDAIIAGMMDTAERRESINFSEPYRETTYGLMVLADSPYLNATSIQDFSGAAVLGQQGTALDDVIEQIEGVDHLSPVGSVPDMISRLQQGTCRRGLSGRRLRSAR